MRVRVGVVSGLLEGRDLVHRKATSSRRMAYSGVCMRVGSGFRGALRSCPGSSNIVRGLACCCAPARQQVQPNTPPFSLGLDMRILVNELCA